MIKHILEILRQSRLMDLIESDLKKMMDLAERSFLASSEAVLEGKEVDFDLYAQDREINLLVINTRKRIVEHLSVGRATYPVGELVFITLINNLERIGDYSKNLYDLYRRTGGPLKSSKYIEGIREMRETLVEFFPMTRKALFDDDEKMAREVMDRHLDLVKTYNRLIVDLMHDEEMDGPQAVALTIMLRTLKRVSSHLKTIASSAVSPFMLMGFRQMPEVKKEKGIEDDD